MDYLGWAIKKLSDGQVKDSFNQLRKKCNDYLSKDLIHVQLGALINNATWFDQLKSVRDELVHNGAVIFVYGMGDPSLPIAFDIKKNGRHQLTDPAFKYYDTFANGVCSFNSLAAIYLALTYQTLNEFARIVGGIHERDVTPESISVLHPGLGRVREWMQRELSGKNCLKDPRSES